LDKNLKNLSKKILRRKKASKASKELSTLRLQSIPKWFLTPTSQVIILFYHCNTEGKKRHRQMRDEDDDEFDQSSEIMGPSYIDMRYHY